MRILIRAVEWTVDALRVWRKWESGFAYYRLMWREGSIEGFAISSISARIQCRIRP